MVLVGISDSDTKEIADKMIQKLIGLRIFEDENGKTNLSIKDVNGDLLIVSQFTLYADCKKGNRPSYVRALGGDKALPMYERFNELLNQEVPTKGGVFGADMKVEILNDGPTTIIIDTELK